MAYQQSYEHLTGWAADILVSLDIIDVGLLGVVARTSPERRQAILCVLAHVGGSAIARIQCYDQPKLCDEIIGLKPVARDIRRLPTPELLRRYVPGSTKELRRSLGRTERSQSPDYYRDLAGRCRADGVASAERIASAVGPTTAENATTGEKAIAGC